ncbi:MAG: isoprenylcysteine carboxylmethyltransferase family protein [candidate division Zixibacteria bacterium]|jgi:protein-S-isoprenylcysteine O-methyltransferase Ste14|nr:isoprenylcysteine carboxylmethyltransferase family protein [candidate division Zixibacteria bacterium]
MTKVDRLWVLGQWTFLAGFILVLILVSPSHDPLLPAWFGIILCVLGPIIVAFAVRSHRAINHSVRVKVGPSPDPEKKLVDCGIYTRVRHPMYFAAILLLLGAAVWRGSFVALGYVGLAVVFLYFKASYEERLLLQTYSDYPAYMKRTGRLLPRLWR